MPGHTIGVMLESLVHRRLYKIHGQRYDLDLTSAEYTQGATDSISMRIHYTRSEWIKGPNGRYTHRMVGNNVIVLNLTAELEES